jgi:hypothetical protein
VAARGAAGRTVTDIYLELIETNRGRFLIIKETSSPITSRRMPKASGGACDSSKSFFSKVVQN